MASHRYHLPVDRQENDSIAVMIGDSVNNLSSYSTDTVTLYLERSENFGFMVVTAITLALSAVIGTLGNILVIGSICFVRSLRTTGNIFILNLALADTIVTVLVDPFNVVGAVAGRQVLMERQTLCSVIASLCAPACIGSLWNMCAISTNRYILICKPHLYPSIFTTRNCILICIGIWVLSHLIHLPNHLGWGTNHFSKDFVMCTFDVDNHHFAIYYAILVVVVPLIGVLYGYTSIFLKVRAVKRKVMHHRGKSFENTTITMSSEPTIIGATATDGQDGKKSNLVADKKRSSVTRLGYKQDDVKLAKTLFTAFVVFFISWTPFALLILANNPRVIPGWVYIAATIMGHGNSAVNPILYGMSNKKFRDGYRRFLINRRSTDDAPLHEKSFVKTITQFGRKVFED